MAVSAQFLRISEKADFARTGEVRILRICGLDGSDIYVFLDKQDTVTRVRQGSTESTVVPWDVQQVLRDVLDPHAVSAE